MTSWVLAENKYGTPPIRKCSMTDFGRNIQIILPFSAVPLPPKWCWLLPPLLHRLWVQSQVSRNTAWSLSEYLSIRTVEFWKKPRGTLDTASHPLSLPPQLSLCLSLSFSSLSLCVSLTLAKLRRCTLLLSVPSLSKSKPLSAPLQPPNQPPVKSI